MKKPTSKKPVSRTKAAPNKKTITPPKKAVKPTKTGPSPVELKRLQAAAKTIQDIAAKYAKPRS